MEEKNTAPSQPEADGTMAEALAAAMGTKAEGVEGDAGETGEEEVIQVDPTGRMVDVTKNGFHWGTGRRKDAIARVRIRPGTGQFMVNGKSSRDYFTRIVDHTTIEGPLVALKVHKKVDVFVSAQGGGVTGQAGAVRLGLGRALMGLYPDAHEPLRDSGHLSRDSRMVERKKYGRHGARRGHQWGKR
jgi:small subunit ribosomal protein S9